MFNKIIKILKINRFFENSFNYIMVGLTIISVIMCFLAPLYCTEKELNKIIKYMAGRY